MGARRTIEKQLLDTAGQKPRPKAARDVIFLRDEAAKIR